MKTININEAFAYAKKMSEKHKVTLVRSGGVWTVSLYRRAV